MKNILLASMTFLSTMAFIACEEDDHGHTGPTATITGPTGEFENGDTVHLQVAFADGHELHEWLVTVTRQLDDSLVQRFSGHTHEATYTVSEHFQVHTFVEHSDFTVIATVSNHDGETASDTATFHVHH